MAASPHLGSHRNTWPVIGIGGHPQEYLVTLRASRPHLGRHRNTSPAIGIPGQPKEDLVTLRAARFHLGSHNWSTRSQPGPPRMGREEEKEDEEQQQSRTVVLVLGPSTEGLGWESYGRRGCSMYCRA